jgi:hypothetical protein
VQSFYSQLAFLYRCLTGLSDLFHDHLPLCSLLIPCYLFTEIPNGLVIFSLIVCACAAFLFPVSFLQRLPIGLLIFSLITVSFYPVFYWPLLSLLLSYAHVQPSNHVTFFCRFPVGLCALFLAHLLLRGFQALCQEN